MTKLSELFAAPRGNLVVAGRYSGKNFYTSNELKAAYLLAIKKSSKASAVYKKILELVQMGIISPVYKEKSFLKSIFKRTPIEFRGMAGLAISDINLIFVFVETDENLFSFVSSDALATVTLHELMHLFSFKKPKEFLNIFGKDLTDFYKAYFCKILNCKESDIPDSSINELVRFIYYNFEVKNFYTAKNKKLSEYYNILNSIFKDKSSLPDQTFEKLITDYIVMIKLIQKFEVFGKSHEIIKVATVYKHLISPLYTTYKTTFNVDALEQNVFTYQELFFPSEIISLLTLSSSQLTKIYKAVNQL